MKYLRCWIYFRRFDIKVNGSLCVLKPELISIGRNCVINRGVWLVPGTEITIGDSVVISPEAMLLGADLDRDARDMHLKGTIILEDNVWVGSRSIILKNVRVGRNSVIGAGSVVTKDVPPDTVAAGNPAKVIKRR